MHHRDSSLSSDTFQYIGFLRVGTDCQTDKMKCQKHFLFFYESHVKDDGSTREQRRVADKNVKAFLAATSVHFMINVHIFHVDTLEIG